MKTALLATAAFAAVTTSASANELADLKAQIEALNARISQVEAAPSVPAGYQLVSITKGQALKFGLDSDVDAPATLISVLPAADAPAGTVVSISGNVKAALYFSNDKFGAGRGLDGIWGTADDVLPSKRNGDNDLDVRASGGLTVAGVTDTAVGEVGAKISLVVGHNSVTGGDSIGQDGFWGYWEFADGMKIGGGRDGSLASVSGIESKTSRHFVGAFDGRTVQGGNGDDAQIRLSYSSGPLGFAVAVEDASRGVAGLVAPDADDDALGFAGEVTYAGDMFSLELAGGFWGDDDANSLVNTGKKHQVGLGAGFNVSEGIALSTGAIMGKRHNGEKFWNVGASTRLSVADGISFELGAGYGKDGGVKATDVLGGIYYSPVSQLVIGLEGGWSKRSNKEGGAAAAFVTKYSF